VQKLRAQEIKEQWHEVERGQWFNQVRPMTASVKTWKEKRIEREERGSSLSSEDGQDNAGKMGVVDVNMVFQLPPEFSLP
jgi:hypothetical protein